MLYTSFLFVIFASWKTDTYTMRCVTETTSYVNIEKIPLFVPNWIPSDGDIGNNFNNFYF